MALDIKDSATKDIFSSNAGRPRIHSSNAARQKAYRERLKKRQMEGHK